jgi:putative ABC transport system permease protein
MNSRLGRELSPGGNIIYVRLFSIIAIFILLIACINFTNISTIQSVNNAKDIGVYKVFGEKKPQLIMQFLSKSFFLSFVSLILAVGITFLLLPYFNTLSEKQLSVNFMHNPLLALILFLVVLFVSLLSGSYPAFLIASFNPVTVLKGKLTKNKSRISLQNILVIFQFTITIIIIICTGVIYKQLNFFQNYNLGFNKEYVVAVHRGKAIQESQRDAFKQELLTHSEFTCASFCQDIPADSHFEFFLQLEGADNTDLHNVSFIRADYDYANTLSLQLKEGRFFSKDFGMDSMAVVINEAAVKEFGIKDPLNQRFFLGTDSNNVSFYWHIIGVVKDYNFKSLKLPVTPIVIQPRVPNWAYFILVKVKPGNISQALSKLETTWDKFAGGQPFEYTFLDEAINDLYKSEILTKKLFAVFSLLSIIIACLGLFSLSLYIMLQRTKEIGLRKVNGAKTFEVMSMLLKSFGKWVAISFIVAFPISYLAMQKWLQNYAYHTNMSWWIFALAAAIAFSITLITVSWQSWRAARRNPIEALRYE